MITLTFSEVTLRLLYRDDDDDEERTTTTMMMVIMKLKMVNKMMMIISKRTMMQRGFERSTTILGGVGERIGGKDGDIERSEEKRRAEEKRMNACKERLRKLDEKSVISDPKKVQAMASLSLSAESITNSTQYCDRPVRADSKNSPGRTGLLEDAKHFICMSSL
ncbi:hypothetical protein PoB_007720100 [Plakobranchus ocellatus]|uniref:Uncharacterized protein n=1 Tax=Plakobranchus ocellatus TaxID=259542 RepID=A0AAV4E4Z6_9GAST|nr:hypothetical protein PoB_007720100 [Plakobranchus ocellatus]